MKIAILSREPGNYSTKRLKEACLQRGHIVKVLDTLKFSIRVEKSNPRLFYRGKPLSKYDAVIPRIGASITFFGASIIRQFEQMGVFCLNTSLSITSSRDKLRAIQTLSRHDIGIPVTAFVKDKKEVLQTIEQVGQGGPVVIKLLEGTQGIGVILADSKKVAEAIVETMQGANINVLIQNFVKESRGKDIRAFVVGGKVVAAMRRVAQGNEFRSNVHRGGHVEKVKLNPAYEKTALNAAQIMGLDVAGVDMLEGNDGPQLMEVNSSPGLEGIEAATGKDIASSIIRYLEKQVLFPEIDIRQRMTLKSGYGVVELPVLPRSKLENITLREAGLTEREVLVLSILRGSVTLPIPKSSDKILAGDTLLCFGKNKTLKSLLPVKRKKRSKKPKKKADN